MLKQDLLIAYLAARKNKRKKIDQLKFEIDFENNLSNIYQKINNQSYQPTKSRAFIINKPVKREIFAAHFQDRVVHHLIYQYLNPIIDKKLIYDTYACRPKKGVVFGINRLKKFLKAVSNNYQTEAWILKIDISGYFMNMNREILFNNLIKMINRDIQSWPEKKQATLLFLLKENIFNQAIKNCNIIGKTADWQDLPKNKSLFYSPKNCGLPIGNLTSQLFGNVYLNYFDHYVKRELKIKYYGRYVDDMVFMHKNKNFLKNCLKIIKKVLLSKFKLSIHPKKIYLQPVAHGVYFLGQYIKPRRSYIAKRPKNSFYQAIKKINQQWDNFLKNNPQTQTENLEIILQQTINIINSYLGLFRHANSYKLRKKIIEQLNNRIWQYITIDKNIAKIMIKKDIKEAIFMKKVKDFTS